MASYPKIGSPLALLGLGTSGNSAFFASEYFYNQTESIRGNAKEWVVAKLAAYLPKHIRIFCFIIGWLIARGIWRWAHNPLRMINLPPHAFCDKSNPATPGAPSEIGDEDMVIRKCKSLRIAKLRSTAGISSTTGSNEAA